MEIVAKDGPDAYAQAVAAVKNGVPRVSRNLRTLDVGYASILVESPLDIMPLQMGRRLVAALGACEALQLIGAVSAPHVLLKIVPRFKDYAEADGSFHGAYGSRIKMQLMNATNKLRLDPGSRQSVITLWDSHLDNLGQRHDYPCTVALQFQVEGGRLCMNTVMRSNDVWLGLPYDMFQFAQLQLTVARSLSLAYGWYRHTTLSLHVYEKDIPSLDAIYPQTIRQFQPLGIGEEHETIPEIMRQARRLLIGTGEPRNESERWYANVLAPYREVKNGAAVVG